MRIFDSIFSRKMPTPIAAPTVPQPTRDELDELHLSLEMQRAEIAGMRAEARDCDQQLAEIGRLASSLKVRISEHDSNATAGLDALEREELGIRRVRDGLLLRIQAQQTAMQPLEQRAAELASERDQVRQDLLVAEMKQGTRQHLDEIEALWREGCSLAFNLMEMISAPNSGRTVLDDSHRAAVLALRNEVNKRLLHLRLLRTNEHWISYGEGGFPALAIIPARPREALTIVETSKSA